MADFDGYPLDTNVSSDTPAGAGTDDYHAEELHNTERRALNSLQAQINALTASLSTHTTQITNLQTAVAVTDSAWTAYTPTLTNVTVGTGSVYGRYLKQGRLLQFYAGFKLGSGFTMANGSPIGITIPFNAKADADRPQVIAAYAINNSVQWPSSGTGVILSTAPNRITRFAGDGYFNFTPSPWDRNNPQVWAANDSLHVSGVVELASV